MKRMHPRVWLIVTGLILASSAALLLSGCEENCAAVESSYRNSLRTERTALVEADDIDGDSPAQFGLALKADLIGDLLDIVLQPAIEAALSASSSVVIDGERVSLEPEGQLVDLDIDADSACEHCFRISARLDGAIVADIPSWGRERANLGGSLSIVAPLLLERGESADAALKLDIPAFWDIGKSSLSANLRDVDPDVADLLEGPLSDLLLELIVRRVDPVTIVEFDAPSFGIPGLEVLPVQLVTDGETNTVFAGFATNIEALNVPGAAGVAPITDLGADENLALAFQPAIINHSLSLLMEDAQVARTYTGSGQASEDGSAHVTLDGFDVGQHVLQERGEADSDAGYGADAMSVDGGFSDAGGAPAPESPDVPFALGFEVFNFSNQDKVCFNFGAEAVGGVSVRDNALEVSLIDVRFTNQTLQDNLVEISNWMGADFVQRSRTLVSQSIDQAAVAVPGTALSFGALALETRPNAVVLRSNSTASAVAE